MEVIFYSFQSYDDKGTFAELTLPFRINISELTINTDIFLELLSHLETVRWLRNNIIFSSNDNDNKLQANKPYWTK